MIFWKHSSRKPVSMHDIGRAALKSKPFLAIFLFGLLFVLPWISGRDTDLSIECTSICVKAAHKIAALRAENAMLRSILHGNRDCNGKTRVREDAMVYQRKVVMQQTLPGWIWIELLTTSNSNHSHCRRRYFDASSYMKCIYLNRTSSKKPKLSLTVAYSYVMESFLESRMKQKTTMSFFVPHM